MHNQLTAENRDAILQAIAKLHADGCDVNAYTVAGQANVPRALILRDAEIMSLLSKTRTGNSTNGNNHHQAETQTQSDSRLQERLDQSQLELDSLHRELDQTRWDNQILRKQVEDLQSEINKLRYANERLQEEAQAISKSVNIAWQQGYLAGQQAAMSDGLSQKSFVETLAEAARAATTSSGVQEEVQPAPVSAPEQLFADENTPDSGAYVADVPLQLDDPEVLSDPFTAKLMNALQADQTDTLIDRPALTHLGDTVVDMPALDRAALEADTEETATNRPALTPEEVERWARSQGIPAEQARTLLNSLDSQSQDEMVHTGYSQPGSVATANLFVGDTRDLVADQEPTLVDAKAISPQAKQQAAAEAEGLNPDQFTAEELHNLFRNRYVRHDDPPEQPAAPQPKSSPETSQTTKKFVGGKHASTTEPVSAIPRVFPPDIRKACRLLGVLPEELTKQTVLEAWKREMAKPGVHPDTGGDTEMAIYLNTAKDTLIRWVEAQTPKLGKKFGSQQGKTNEAPKPQPKPE